jgi:threonine/homoserine/homoserine lactone efflux protein
MEPIVFLKGLLVGLFMCAPVGPVGLVCVKRTLTHGTAWGLVSVLGAATVDGLYCSIAGFGLTVVSHFLESVEVWLKVAGGLILVLVGINIFLARPSSDRMPNDVRGLLSAYSSAFLLMVANPFPIVVFAAMFTALGLTGWKGDYLLTATLVMGVFTGSALWAPILVAIVRRFRPNIHTDRLGLVNRISGSIIAILGVGLILITLG